MSMSELSAHLDGALGRRSAEKAERHLAACKSCRAALAELASQDEALRPALTHAPDEAYFERFPARVEDRIRAAGLAGAQSRRPGAGFGSLFSPRGLAWAGAAATVVVGAGLALITTREVRPPELRDREIAERAAPSEPNAARRNEALALVPESAPREGTRSPSALAGREQDVITGSPSPTSLDGGRATDRDRAEALAKERSRATPRTKSQERKVGGSWTPLTRRGALDAQRPSLGRAVPVQKNEAGEDVPVPRPGQPTFAPPPPTSAADEEEAARVRKKLLAEPMKDAKTWGSTKSLYRDGPVRRDSSKEYSFIDRTPSAAGQAMAPEGVAIAEGRLCGQVLDTAGRPVTGAQVVVADLGRTATTDARGGFCIGAPIGEHPLSVMAVGYSESRQTVRVGGEQAAVRVLLAAVPVIEGPDIAAERPLAIRSFSPTQRIVDPYAGLSDTMQTVVREAQRLESDAARRRSATLFDASAARWERALRRLAAGPLELETRRNLAEARYRAWELGRNGRRAAAAIEALTAYVARAPSSPERAQATRWLDQVRR
jgi:carboxypeptidase family protein/putative zinc finger protein